MPANAFVRNPPACADVLESVPAHPFLEGLKTEQLAKLAECSMAVHFAAGQLIFREGEPANRFYLIRQGKVALEIATGDAAPVPIQTIGAGDVLGWSWLFPPYHWHFDARALTPVNAVFFCGTRLREECEADPALGCELMKRAAAVTLQRLQGTRRQLLAACPAPASARSGVSIQERKEKL